MYIRKFEADTLDDALKEIKAELGPDAIILKTITNKGLKGAFKKRKIEITAAISEKNYTSKAKVDHVLDDDQKEKFYNAPSSFISNLIDQYSKGDSKKTTANPIVSTNHGYSKMGINKSVQTVSKEKETLDQFLNVNGPIINKPDASLAEAIISPVSIPEIAARPVTVSIPESHYQDSEIHQENIKRIEDLEKKLFALTQQVERKNKKEFLGLYQLRTTLSTLDISEVTIQELIKKCTFELTEDELEDADIVFELVLREMLDSINIGMPLFSKLNSADTPVVSIFISEGSCGQSSMMQKVASMKKETVIIRYNDNDHNDLSSDFASKVFDIKVISAKSMAEVVGETRKCVERSESVFIDFKLNKSGIDESKKIIDGIKRGFDNVEVVLGLSAIHDENYNRKMLAKYNELLNGINITHLDLCINYGAIFNISKEFNHIPYYFFGTGAVIPDDIEAATAERVLGGIFNIN